MKKLVLSVLCICIILLFYYKSKVEVNSVFNYNYNENISKEAIYSRKAVFLTFDDGPSWNNTDKILDILKENQVKATFFVVGSKVEHNKPIVEKMHKYGMCILPHTFSHDYKYIYSSKENYVLDLTKCIEAIKNITKEDVYGFTRLPGGAYNKVSNPRILEKIKGYLKENKIRYLDWNVSGGDASQTYVHKDIIKENILKQCEYWNTPIVLMHDSESKNTTVEALPSIIKQLKSRGYTFYTLKELDEEHVNNLIKYKIIDN